MPFEDSRISAVRKFDSVWSLVAVNFWKKQIVFHGLFHMGVALELLAPLYHRSDLLNEAHKVSELP